MVSKFGEAGMGLEYKVWQLPIDQRAILINPQKGTAGSLGGIDKMQSKDEAGWEYCMVMLIKAHWGHLLPSVALESLQSITAADSLSFTSSASSSLGPGPTSALP